MVNKFSSENFENEVEKSEGVVLVDFYADWCGPCKMMSPVIDEIAEEITDIKVGKVNCDEEMSVAERYEVMSIPTIIVFKNGKVAKTFIGVQSKEDIINAINQAK